MTALVMAMPPTAKVKPSESPAPSAQADDSRVERQGGSAQQQAESPTRPAAPTTTTRLRGAALEIALWGQLGSELRERGDRVWMGDHVDLWHVSHIMLAAAAKSRQAGSKTLTRVLLDTFDAAAKLVSVSVSLPTPTSITLL